MKVISAGEIVGVVDSICNQKLTTKASKPTTMQKATVPKKPRPNNWTRSKKQIPRKAIAYEIHGRENNPAQLKSHLTNISKTHI